VAAQGAINDLVGTSERLLIDARPLDLVMKVLGDRAKRDGEFVLAQLSRSEAPVVAAALVRAGAELVEMRWIKRDLEAVFFEETDQ
jgi:hypothetical protein